MNALKKTFKKVNRVLLVFNNKFLIFILFIIAVIFASSKVISAIVYQFFIDSLATTMGTSSIFQYGIISVYLVIISTAAYFFFITIRRRIFHHTLKNLQEEKLATRASQSTAEQDAVLDGDWMTLMTSDSSTLANFIPNVLFINLFGSIQFLFAILYGVLNSIPLTLIILVTTLLSHKIPMKFSKSFAENSKDVKKKESRLRNFLLTSLDKISIIKAYAADNFFIKKFDSLYVNYAHTMLNKKKIDSTAKSFNGSLGFLMNAIWMSFGLFLISQDYISLGVFAGFITLSNYYNFPFNNFGILFSEIESFNVCYDRFFENHTPQHSLQDQEVLTLDPCSIDQIICENLSFSYTEQTAAFDQISFDVAKKLSVSLEGPSGCGKSTLMKVLMGLYPSSSGTIKYRMGDTLFSPSQLVSNFSYVPQGDSLFSGTIRENLLFGNPHATEQDLYDILKKVNLFDLVMNLPQKLDFSLTEGENAELSGGEKQRIAIARALLKNAPLYFLDEITSALDPANEKVILDVVKDLPFVSISHKINEIIPENQRISFLK